MSPALRLTVAVLRRDRWQLALWVGGISALALAASTAIATQFGDEADRAAIISVAVVSPAFLFLRGIPDGSGVGAVFFFQGFTFIAVLAGLMSTFSVVRNTRAEEDAGRAELLAATPVRREARLVSALTVAVVTNSLLAASLTAALTFVGLDARGALLTGLATASVGVIFAAVAAVASQLAPSSRAANGISAALVGAAYAIRGIGDAFGTADPATLTVASAWPSWWSPIGLAQHVAPFSDADATPLAVNLALATALATIAIVAQARRDIGSSLVKDRPGPARATALRRTAGGVAWTLQRPSVVGWALGAALLASLAGALAPSVARAVAGNDALSDLIARLLPGTGGTMVDVFTTGILGICGTLAAAAGVHAVLRLRSEEASGAAESLLAGPLSRARWMLGHVGVAIAAVVVVALAAGAAAGIVFVSVGEGWDRIPSSVAATLAHVPAALTLVAAASLVFGLVPRLTIPLGWGALILALVIGQLGDLLRLPEWAQNLSPFHHSSALPLEPLDVPAAGVMTALAVVGIAAAVAAFRRRDLQA